MREYYTIAANAIGNAALSLSERLTDFAEWIKSTPAKLWRGK